MLPTSFFSNQKNLLVGFFSQRIAGGGWAPASYLVSYRDGDLQPNLPWLKSGALQGKNAHRRYRCTAGATLQNLSWQRFFHAGRSVSTAGHQHLFFDIFGPAYWCQNHAMLHLPSSGYFDIIPSCPKSDKKPPVLKFNSSFEVNNQMFEKPKRKFCIYC